MGLLDSLKNIAQNPIVDAAVSAADPAAAPFLQAAAGISQSGQGQGSLPPELQALLQLGQAAGGNNVQPFNLANLAQLSF